MRIFAKYCYAVFVNNQLDTQLFFMYVYFYSLHVLGSHVPIIRRIVSVRHWYMSLCIDDRLVCRFLHLHGKQSSVQSDIYQMSY